MKKTTQSFTFNAKTDALFRAVLSLRDIKECEAFFRDLCTISELKAMTERWQIVLLLRKGVPYRKIAEEVGSSTATVTRVAHWLANGEGGYKKMVERMEKTEKNEKAS